MAKTKKTTKKATGEVTAKPFSVTLTIAGKEYKGEGNSVLECVKQLNPDFMETEGLLLARKGELKSEVFLRPFQIRLLANNEDTKILMAHRLEVSLQ